MENVISVFSPFLLKRAAARRNVLRSWQQLFKSDFFIFLLYLKHFSQTTGTA